MPSRPRPKKAAGRKRPREDDSALDSSTPTTFAVATPRNATAAPMSPTSKESILRHAEGLASAAEWKAYVKKVEQMAVKPDSREEMKAALADLTTLITSKRGYTIATFFNFFKSQVLLHLVVDSPNKTLSLDQHVIQCFGSKPSKASVVTMLREINTVEGFSNVLEALAALPSSKDREGHNVTIALMRDHITHREDVGLIRRSAEYVVKICDLPSHERDLAGHAYKRATEMGPNNLLKALFGDQTARRVAERLLIGRIEDSEALRAVRVNRPHQETATVTALSKMILAAPATAQQPDAELCKCVVLAGGSGSGKTVASMLGTTLGERQFAIYLGTVRYVSFKDANKANEDDALIKALTELIEFATGIDLNGDFRLDPSPCDVVLSIVADELGGSPGVLRALLRMCRPGSAARANFVSRIQQCFGVQRVCFVAVGTGCEDAAYPAGSQPDTYSTIFTSAADGLAIWDSLATSLLGGADRSVPACMHGSHLLPYVLALLGGNALGSQRLEGPLERVTSQPDGFVASVTGRWLVTSPRIAALLARHAEAAFSSLRPFTDAPEAVRVEAALPYVSGAHHYAVNTFVHLNGLRDHSESHRMEITARAIALMLNATDADLPPGWHSKLCCQSGVLTSNAVVVGNAGSPRAGRIIEASASVERRLVVKDGGLRYRVSDAVMAMYLTGFGAARRATLSWDAFEMNVLDYLRTVVVPASMVASWSLSPNGALRGLSKPSAAAGVGRGELFGLLVRCFAESKVESVSSVFVHRLTRAFEPTKAPTQTKATKQTKGKGNRRCKSRPPLLPMESVSDIWSEVDALAAKGSDSHPTPRGNGSDVAIVLNADKAAGADLIVLCRGHFAIHVQVKSHQRTPNPSVDALVGEYTKMGAAAMGAVSSSGDGAAGLPPSCFRGAEFNYFVLLRCTDGDNKKAASVGLKVAAALGSSFAGAVCKYMEVVPTRSSDDRAQPSTLYPLITTPQRHALTPPLLHYNYFSCETVTD